MCVSATEISVNIQRALKDRAMPKRCLPLSVKLKVLADQEKGFGPKALMKRYKLKKSTYYRILSEKEAIRNFALKCELKPKLETDDDDDDVVDTNENGENRDKIQESQLDENEEEMHCDTPSSFEGVNEAVMQWYSKQEAGGVPVDSGDIDEAAERLAQKLGFTDFKLNSSGWPLRFRKPQDDVKTTTTVNMDEEENPIERVKKVLRIQDQITAFQRLQAGESAEQIGEDLGVSKATILSVKKKLKDTLFTPSLDTNYQISVERLNTNAKHENALQEKFSPEEELSEDDNMPNASHNSDDKMESVWAAIERRKQLNVFKNKISTRERSLTHDEALEAISMYKAGITIREIARNFSVSASTIQRAKKKYLKVKKYTMNYLKLEEKVSIIERLDEGETVAEISEELRLPDYTIRGIKKSKSKIMNVYKASTKSMSRASSTLAKSRINEKMEKRLLAWINDLKRRKIQMTSAMILKKALMIQMNISQEEGGPSSQSFIPSKDWLDTFKRRHNIQKILHEECESGSESDHQRFWKAGPKSKKRRITGPRRNGGLPGASQPPKVGMALSKLAEGLREMYLSSTLPADPYRCNAFTPRVILSHMEEELIRKYTISDTIKNESPSDEETWLTAHTNACSDTDWGEQDWDTDSRTEIPKSKDNSRKKRKKTSSEHNRKRRRLSDGYSSDDRFDANFVNVPIKQEPQSSLDSVHSSVPMAVLPAGSAYVPPLPMFQMPTTGLTVFMPESQQMMMQHSVSYPHDNSSDLFINQQHIGSRSVTNSPPIQFNDIHSGANIKPNIRQGNENVIVMPFGRDLCEQENSGQLLSAHPDSVCDSLAEKTRKDRAAAIAESIGISLEGSSNKKLRDLTFKLFELNNKNLICDERIDKAREDYEKTVTHIEAEKKINDKEIDKVLAAVQEWKRAKNQSNA